MHALQYKVNRFLWGGPFQGLVDGFGRPEARQWSGLARGESGAPASAPVLAVRRAERVLHMSAPGRDRLPRGRQW